jgi:hypothetical protein
MLVNELIKKIYGLSILFNLPCFNYIFVNLTKFFEFFSKELQMNILLLKKIVEFSSFLEISN